MSTPRQQNILSILSKQDSISVRELARLLFISEASIRRDIEALEKEGLVRKVYGGVMSIDSENSVVPLAMRDGAHSYEKDKLAKRAAELVQDGDTLMMDASSTVRRMAKYLIHKHNLTIITYNSNLLDTLSKGDIRIFCTGGEYVPENHAFCGSIAERMIRSMSADKLFFSSQGMSIEGEICDNSEYEIILRRAMMDRSKQKFCLMDSSKLGRRCVFSLCQKEELDMILCNIALPWDS